MHKAVGGSLASKDLVRGSADPLSDKWAHPQTSGVLLLGPASVAQLGPIGWGSADPFHVALVCQPLHIVS